MNVNDAVLGIISRFPEGVNTRRIQVELEKIMAYSNVSQVIGNLKTARRIAFAGTRTCECCGSAYDYYKTRPQAA